MAFSFRIGTNWCHDFPKLARESGFYFNMHGSRVRVDWNRISAIDIDRVIRERDFITIDENINNVIDYSLESEYDVKILDPNFVKLFRLAQLSVEYLLYCKQYLDHSVIILKDELRLKIEQNVSMKKEVTALEDTIKNLKEKSKEKCKLVETRMGDSTGEIYKCPHCPKTFVSALFVNAHVARRHSYISDIRASNSPVHEHYRAETEKLHNEIKTLKERLNQTERVIRNESDKLLNKTEVDYLQNRRKSEFDIATTDRQHEQRRYQEDINSLKNMLFNEIRVLREKEHTVNESFLETNVKTLISQQEREIESLRNQLLERLTPGIENMQSKLQTQENYWKAKMEDVETQHRRDIEKLTTELKVTQQTADRMKSEYASKVHDLQKQSMDQSNLLMEQGKQLDNLSREISNSQVQSNGFIARGKVTVEKFHESPLLKIRRDSVSNYVDEETSRRNLNGNGMMVIEDIGSETSQESSNKLISTIAVQSKRTADVKDTPKFKNTSKLITDFLKEHTERTVAKSDRKNLGGLDVTKKSKDEAKRHETPKSVDVTDDHSRRSFSIKDSNNFPTTKEYNEIETKHSFLMNKTGNKKRLEFSDKRSVSSVTESESSSMSESESDSESVTADDDVTVKKYETPVVKAADIRNESIQMDARSMFDDRLRDLGIDPEWQGIPLATYKQKLEIVKHQQNINGKKLAQYNRIKQKILEDVVRIISATYKESEHATKKSPLHKLVTHVKSKALKTLGNHKDNDKHAPIQKTENTTPSKLRLRQKIELLPKKYKDEEALQESPLKRNISNNTYASPKVVLTQPRLIGDRYKSASRSTSSASSVENSPVNVKPISSTKITVLDTNARKIVGSPIGRKQSMVLTLSENDSTRQESTIASPKNNKSVLKPTSGSVGSLIKKKVFFDLEDENNDVTVPENDERKSEENNSDWNISSSPERKEYPWQKEKSMSTGNIVLRTSQSEKIAEISKKIQEQLNIVRKPPAGSVETIFRSNMSLQELTNYDAGNRLLNSTSPMSSISGSPVQNFTSPTARSNMLFPQPAPRTLKDKTLARPENESSPLKYSDLDSDINEILQME